MRLEGGQAYDLVLKFSHEAFIKCEFKRVLVPSCPQIISVVVLVVNREVECDIGNFVASMFSSELLFSIIDGEGVANSLSMASELGAFTARFSLSSSSFPLHSPRV